ncbi:MAG: hypothetical protein JNK37_07300 [Verrucomicrobiales bacterium]|nr:hypothetical protein [Verrucomicrobiales bacterium]
MTDPIHPVWKKYPGLAWSNRFASDSIRIRVALCRPRFDLLLDLALVFGLDRLEREWRVLEEEGSPEVCRVTPRVERILNHIAEGFRRANARS